MVALLMLGIIPGTNIQINFEEWLAAMVCLAVAYVVFKVLKKRLVLILIIALSIRHSTNTARPTVRLA